MLRVAFCLSQSHRRCPWEDHQLGSEYAAPRGPGVIRGSVCRGELARRGKPIATPTDAKLKAFHDSVISLAKANASLYAAKKPFPEFYKMYLNNLVAFNSREASQFKVSDLVGKPEFGDIEHELHENILDWGTYSISGSKFEVTPLYSFFAKLPNLPPMWKQYFDVMALGG